MLFLRSGRSIPRFGLLSSRIVNPVERRANSSIRRHCKLTWRRRRSARTEIRAATCDRTFGANFRQESVEHRPAESLILARRRFGGEKLRGSESRRDRQDWKARGCCVAKARCIDASVDATVVCNCFVMLFQRIHNYTSRARGSGYNDNNMLCGNVPNHAARDSLDLQHDGSEKRPYALTIPIAINRVNIHRVVRCDGR